MAKRLRSRLRTVNSGVSRFPFPETPSLILDFVPVADPVDGASLAIRFTSSSYITTEPDPIAPNAKLNLQVWN